MCSEAFFRFRYALLWFPSSVRGMLEPISACAVCAWLAYGSWDAAAAHQTEAAVLVSLLGLGFLGHAIPFALGLIFGGSWREAPKYLNWSFVMKMEMAAPFYNAAIVSHWSRMLGRAASTPALASFFVTGIYVSVSASYEPFHWFVVRQLITAHHCAVFAYEVLTTPGWNDPDQGGPYREVEFVFTVVLEMFVVYFLAYISSRTKGEAESQRDIQAHAQATLQRDVTLALVANFLPPAVLLHVQERAAVGNASDVIAWKFDPGCVLQSDIVGFTSLGSRVSPEKLCRYAGSALFHCFVIT